MFDIVGWYLLWRDDGFCLMIEDEIIFKTRTDRSAAYIFLFSFNERKKKEKKKAVAHEEETLRPPPPQYMGDKLEQRISHR